MNIFLSCLHHKNFYKAIEWNFVYNVRDQSNAFMNIDSYLDTSNG